MDSRGKHVPWEASDFGWRLDEESALGKKVAKGAVICSICGEVVTQDPCPGPTFYYRFYEYWNDTSSRVCLQRASLLYRTRSGAWIGGSNGRHAVWVANDARKRSHYPTVKLALDSYRHRKHWQLSHARNAMERAARLNLTVQAMLSGPVIVDPPHVSGTFRTDWSTPILGMYGVGDLAYQGGTSSLIEALEAIADGEGDPSEIARQSLALFRGDDPALV